MGVCVECLNFCSLNGIFHCKLTDEHVRLYHSCDNFRDVRELYVKKESNMTYLEYEAAIKDSGDRTEFSTGAVRDMREGKGRCDLMPLDVAGDILDDPVLFLIDMFQKDGDTNHLISAMVQCEIFDDLCTMLLDVAKHFEEGAKKYGENNWQKGIPTWCYIDSAVRHYLKFLRGDKDEPHDRAFVWNLMCCIWTCKNKPEMKE